MCAPKDSIAAPFGAAFFVFNEKNFTFILVVSKLNAIFV